jgi:ABC-2 type transport system permease protein
MFVLGLAFSGEVHDVKIIIVNEDEGFEIPTNNSTLQKLRESGLKIPLDTNEIMLSEEIISNLDEEVLDLSYMDDLDEAIDSVENGKAYGVLHFPINFTQDVFVELVTMMVPDQPVGNTTIDLMLDKSNINVASEIIKTVNKALMKTIEETGYQIPIKINSDDAIYGKDADFMDFFVPGIMSFVVYLLTTLLTLITFVGERGSGTLDRLLVTPLKESEIVLGYAGAFSIIGTVQAAVLLVIGILVFQIMIIGNVLLAFAVIALLAIVCQALGILFSSLAKREAQAIQFLPFIVIPAFLLAGIFWPIEAIPAWLRPASYLIPPTYAVEACRGVMLKGWGLDMIWPDIAALLIFAGVFLTMATWSLKRKRG